MDILSIPSIVPILTSPQLVFFPHTHVCLHVPLPFYERLKKTSLLKDRFVGVILDTKLLCEETMQPIGCVGSVIRSQPLSCGYAVHLDLHGLKRFRMMECWAQEGFSQASINILEYPAENLSSDRKKALLAAYVSYFSTKESAPSLEMHTKADVADEVLVNVLCFESDLSPLDKQFLLEADDLNHQCGRLLDLLRFRLEEVQFNRGVCQKDR
jgi:Lon protease-like protein